MKPINHHRKIEGISAVLLPFHEDGTPDYGLFLAHVERTYAAGLTPAINMDTGYVNLLTKEERLEILDLMPAAANGRRFVAGAFVEGETGVLVSLYTRETDAIQERGGMPILFQSTALTCLPEDELVDVYRKVASKCDQLLAFELGKMFAPFGAIYSLEVFQELMKSRRSRVSNIPRSSANSNGRDWNCATRSAPISGSTRATTSPLTW
jgi:hypothetical protein